MWGGIWSAILGDPIDVEPVVRPEPDPDPGLFAAWWTYAYDNGTHRIACSHLHDSRRKAEQCGASLNSQVERMTREQNVVDSSYVARRLYHNPGHHYIGVIKETDIP